jgi:hypothetical protein
MAETFVVVDPVECGAPPRNFQRRITASDWTVFFLRPSPQKLEAFKQRVRDRATDLATNLVPHPENFPCRGKCGDGHCPGLAAVALVGGPWLQGPGHLIANIFLGLFFYSAEVTATVHVVAHCPCMHAAPPE